ncbi:zinc finger CCCH domain-containing protein 34 isoform X1 [Dendrobium catenatum]|uniref:zinc finger CCCH domain-containing protein 34 isoform X1 n=1 Tax=Dendrobium catenatum TaxID=906689 RepID=UPI0009F206A6|nr:zinc finger CCCH domain-containing protein 34 isoform X1 [Dendrobium catenatum]
METQKSNTDCLYFLASPLTCKKGSECEYRHNDSARLNPRDCWYWLSGSCHNPNCAFRHPPLEVFNGVKADFFYTPSFSAVPTSKLNVPCYFYFNAICAKGEQCPYLHDTFPTQKASRVVPEAAANCPLQNKISSGDTGLASVELPAESLVLSKTMEVSHQAVPSCALEEFSPSIQSILPECEEPADNPIQSVELLDHNGQISPYQSSEEIAKECVEQELDKRWESSPEFDVLVDGGSKQLAYEEDVDYQLAHIRESELFRSSLVEYDFDGPACYDHIGYPEGLNEKFDYIDDIYAAGYFQHSSHLPREEIIFEPMHDDHPKQKLLRRVHELHAREDAALDLREHLKKRRRIDGRWLPFYSRKRCWSHALPRSQEQLTRRGINGSIHCRCASQRGRCMNTSSNGDTYHDRQRWQQVQSGTSKFTRSKHREREKRRQKNSRITSEVQQSYAPDAEKSAKVISNGFDGPKTLAQIKEEKNRSKADFTNYQDFRPQLQRRQATVDFEGPKPLEEILKDKRRFGKPQDSMWAKLEHVDLSCQVKYRTTGAEVNDRHLEATAGKRNREFLNGYQINEIGGYGGSDNVDDDDIFRTKLVNVLSH